ncbi:MAG: hypothetical protein JXA58_04690 [Dehalococcoidia bacterium]|nr:hypothetical protein [Dehalococcoidia bacterium]
MVKWLTWAAAVALLALAACSPSAVDQTADSAANGVDAGVVMEPVVSALASGGDDLPGLSSRTSRGHVWAEPVIGGDTVVLSYEVATLGDHVHLEVPGDGGQYEFIGYFADGGFHLRATVCPNCGAERIEWGASLVVCRACGTTFDLETGEASGDGRSYPEGSIPYSMDGDTIVLSLRDLNDAYARTASGEATLFPLPEVVEDEDRGDRSWPRCCGVR